MAVQRIEAVEKIDASPDAFDGWMEARRRSVMRADAAEPIDSAQRETPGERPPVRNSRASKSAEGVAGWLSDRARDPRVDRLLPRGWTRAARDILSGARGRRVRAPGLLRNLWLQSQERVWAPGSTVHLALRKRFVETEVRRALAAGAKQLVVLGAGLDPLATRIAADVPGTTCIEVDHPASQAVKRVALEADATRGSEGEPEDGCVAPGSGWRVPALVPVDFMRESLADALLSGVASAGSAAFRRDVPTVFVAEGLLMYLDAARVDALFADLAALGAPGSRVVFTYAEGDAQGRARLYRFGLWKRLRLALGGERLMWCPSREDADGLLARHGFRALDTCAAEHRRDLLGDFQPRETCDPFGEVLVVAAIGGDADGS